MDQPERINSLLEEAKTAHGDYERDVLNGVYDQDWPRWYAEFMVDKGLGSLLGRDVTADEVGRFFVTSWDEFKATDAEATETWNSFTARRMAEELGG